MRVRVRALRRAGAAASLSGASCYGRVDEMSWRNVLDGVDAVESWIAGQSYWIQVPLLLAVLLPAGWLLAQAVDRVVEKILWPHTRREIRLAAEAAIAHHAPPAAVVPVGNASVAATAGPLGHFESAAGSGSGTGDQR